MSEFLNGLELPRFVSHKEVQALEIAKVESTGADMGGKVTFKDERFGSLLCGAMMFARYVPVLGDFLVFYADGYKSFSPRAAFVEGYAEKIMTHGPAMEEPTFRCEDEFDTSFRLDAKVRELYLDSWRNDYDFVKGAQWEKPMSALHFVKGAQWEKPMSALAVAVAALVVVAKALEVPVTRRFWK